MRRGARHGPPPRRRRGAAHTLLAVPLGIWSPASATCGSALTGEAADLARELDDDVGARHRPGPAAQRAASESGRVAEMLDLVDAARARRRGSDSCSPRYCLL